MLPPEPILLSTERKSPVLWIRRLVLLSKANASSLIREVPFHRGLNIVRTPASQAGDGTMEFHSIGKTLLVRLLRYSLGEDNYGDAECHRELATLVKGAHLVAQWIVEDESWMVVRPFHDNSHNSSFCFRSEDWEDAFLTSTDRIPFHRFLKHLANQVTNSLPEMETRKGHQPQWLDILAWLSRDCECSYRQANDWRFKEFYDRRIPDLNENSLILQWLCGLLGNDEAECRKTHWQLLSQSNQARQSVERQLRSLEETAARASADLRSSRDQEGATTADEFKLQASDAKFRYADKPRSMIDHFNSIGEKLPQKIAIETLEKEIEDRQSAINDKVKEKNKLEGEAIGVARSLERLRKQMLDPDFLKRCPGSPCQLIEELRKEREIAQHLVWPEHVAELEERLLTITKQRTNVEDELEPLVDAQDLAKAELSTARRNYDAAKIEFGKKLGKALHDN